MEVDPEKRLADLKKRRDKLEEQEMKIKLQERRLDREIIAAESEVRMKAYSRTAEEGTREVREAMDRLNAQRGGVTVEVPSPIALPNFNTMTPAQKLDQRVRLNKAREVLEQADEALRKAGG